MVRTPTATFHFSDNKLRNSNNEPFQSINIRAKLRSYPEMPKITNHAGRRSRPVDHKNRNLSDHIDHQVENGLESITAVDGFPRDS